MRISDWSSDVCSSDLIAAVPQIVLALGAARADAVARLANAAIPGLEPPRPPRPRDLGAEQIDGVFGAQIDRPERGHGRTGRHRDQRGGGAGVGEGFATRGHAPAPNILPQPITTVAQTRPNLPNHTAEPPTRRDPLQ